MPKQHKKPTIATVAAKAKVAPMTVSRVLNRGYVSAKLQARVQRAILELGYVPSSTARSLKSGRTGSIGVAVESVHGAWFMGLLAGIEEEMNKTQVSVMLGSLKMRNKYDPSTVATWIDDRRVDGIIFVRFTREERPLLKAAEEAGIPVSFICPDVTQSAGFTVRCRNEDAGRAIGEHLLSLGHHRIGFAGGPKESIDSVDRLRGLKEAIEAAGGTLNPEDTSFAPNYMPQAGAKAAADYLSRPAGRRPTAMVLGNDSMALAFLRELLSAGLRLPDDVSVAGFDGIEEGERSWPALTTVAQPMQLLGSAACRALLERIRDPEASAVMTAEYPMTLIVRESTGPAPQTQKRAATRVR